MGVNKKYYFNKRIYSISLYGTKHFEGFLENEKQAMFVSLSNLVGENEFFGRFHICELSPEQVYEETDKCKRADGQYVVDGKFYTRQEVEELVKKHCRVIVLETCVLEDMKGGAE